MDSRSKPEKPGGRVVPMRRHPRARAFEAWCRRQGIRPGEPTPAIVSPSLCLFRWDYMTARLKGVGRISVPHLETSREAFCFNVRRCFAVRSGDCGYDFYDAGEDRFLAQRELIHCPHCAEMHLLLEVTQAADLGLLDVRRRRDRAFRWRVRDHRKDLNFKQFPAIPRERIEFTGIGPFLKSQLKPEKARKVARQRKAS